MFHFPSPKNFFGEKYLNFFSACLKIYIFWSNILFNYVGNPEKLIRIPIKFQY